MASTPTATTRATGPWSRMAQARFPASEAETRASLDFLLAHANIAASQHYHSSGGVVLRPPSVPDWRLPNCRSAALHGGRTPWTGGEWIQPVHVGLRLELARRLPQHQERDRCGGDQEGEVRGFPIAEDAYPAFGGSIDGLYGLFGILAFANEIYQLGEDDDGDGRISDVERMAANDAEMDGAAFKDWTDFEHPQLGPVEIGGWRKFGQNNPVGGRIQEEVDRNVAFAVLQASLMPLLELKALEVEDLGDGVSRITATVSNAGYQPTELAIREESGQAVPVRATISLDRDAQLLSAAAEVDLGMLAGHGEAEVTWVVRGGGTAVVEAYHPKAGPDVRKGANGRLNDDPALHAASPSATRASAQVTSPDPSGIF